MRSNERAGAHTKPRPNTPRIWRRGRGRRGLNGTATEVDMEVGIQVGMVAQGVGVGVQLRIPQPEFRNKVKTGVPSAKVSYHSKPSSAGFIRAPVRHHGEEHPGA